VIFAMIHERGSLGNRRKPGRILPPLRVRRERDERPWTRDDFRDGKSKQRDQDTEKQNQ
jgi:hypothetical protein